MADAVDLTHLHDIDYRFSTARRPFMGVCADLAVASRLRVRNRRPVEELASCAQREIARRLWCVNCTLGCPMIPSSDGLTCPAISHAVESAHSAVRRDAAGACERHPAGKRSRRRAKLPGVGQGRVGSST
jgi:hypothetical protein